MIVDSTACTQVVTESKGSAVSHSVHNLKLLTVHNFTFPTLNFFLLQASRLRQLSFSFKAIYNCNLTCSSWAHGIYSDDRMLETVRPYC